MVMSKAQASEDAAADVEVDVVPSGEALRVVSGWMGMTAAEALQEAGPAASSKVALPPKRQQL
jgi:hypothetical protein